MIAIWTAFLLLGPALAPDTAELKAKPGGKVTIKYGAPTWRPEWEDQIVEGMIWRLGSNPPTTISTQPGLIFDDAIVFPGDYNLGIICRSAEAWDLVVHRDGLNYNAGPYEARTSFPLVWLDEKEAHPRLALEMKKTDDGYVFVIGLGRRHLEKPFRTAPSRTLKAKIGKHAFTSTYLERTDVEEMARLIEEEGLCVAKVESKSLSHPMRCVLGGGETTELWIWPPPEVLLAPLRIEGQIGEAKAKSDELVHTIASGRETATFEFVVGRTSYHFDVPIRLFERTPVVDDENEDGK